MLKKLISSDDDYNEKFSLPMQISMPPTNNVQIPEKLNNFKKGTTTLAFKY